MGLKPGDDVFFRLMPEMEIYQGSILTVDEDSLILRPQGRVPEAAALGRYLIIPEVDSDCDYYTEITDLRDNDIFLKRLWTGKRGYFRIDDVFPVVIRKVYGDPLVPRSRIITGITRASHDFGLPDGSINPRIWNMLVDMNAKLELIMEKLCLENEGLVSANNVPVNISASGIRITVNERLEPGDRVEIKMSLPSSPPVGIVTCGEVQRATSTEHGTWEIAIQFINMNDDVRDEIIQYTFQRQRELMQERT
ncbi:MAG: PilZ domain-containing protein [Nitrospirota bacterium]